jgi:glycosyltransferase involved in cell wall biosynthesis
MNGEGRVVQIETRIEDRFEDRFKDRIKDRIGDGLQVGIEVRNDLRDDFRNHRFRGEEARFPGEVALVGFFDPATVAEGMDPEAAAAAAALRSAPGVSLHRLAAALASRGIPATLIGGVPGAVPLRIKSHPLSLAIYGKRGGWAFLWNGLGRERAAILKLVDEIHPALVHAHWTFEGGRAAADWSGPKLLTVHDAAWEYARAAWPYGPASAAYIARWLQNTAATLERFPHAIAVSPYVEAYLRMRHRYRGEIRVIPNALPELPGTIAGPASFPRSGAVTFACHGSPAGVKNVRVALSAFRQLEPHLPGSRLLVFGSGWARAGPEYAGHRIEFRGALPHPAFLRSLVEEVDIWVHPSKTEANPVAPCEAIQAGCPVIAGRESGGVPWTLDYGHAGILVDIEDEDEVAGAMLEVARQRSAYDAMVAYGRRLIRERCDPGRILDLHLQYYRDIIRAHQK